MTEARRDAADADRLFRAQRQQVQEVRAVGAAGIHAKVRRPLREATLSARSIGSPLSAWKFAPSVMPYGAW